MNHPDTERTTRTEADSATPLDELELDEVLTRTLLEQVPDGLMITDENGRIRLVNNTLEEMFGYDRAEILGAYIEALVPENVRARHRAHRVRFRASPHRRPMGQDLELEGRRKDGSTFPVDVSLSPLRVGDEVLTIATVRDITQRRAAEQHSRWVQRLLDSTSDAIYVFDTQTLALLHVNEGACRQTGYSHDELATMTPLHVLPELPERQFRALLEPLSRDGAAKVGFETTIRNAEGDDVPVEMVCEIVQPFPDSDPVYVASARDISDRLESERTLAETRERLALVEDRERIARDLHDKVIQRLFATGLGLQSAAGRADAGPVRDRIHNAIDDLDQAIREIRTSIFALHAPTRSEQTDVRAAVLEKANEVARVLGFAPAVRFSGPVDTATTPPIAEALLATLQEALSNVARHAHASDVHVEVSVDHDQLCLVVCDDGVGVPDDAGSGGGDGVRNMRARVRELGGTMQLQRAQPSGTELRWTVPLR